MLKLNHHIIAALTFSLLSLSPLWSAESNDSYLRKLIYDSCSPQLADSYYRRISGIVSRLAKAKHWRQAAQSTLPVACYNEYPDYLAALAFNLNNYALEQGIKPATIEDLTELLSLRTFGKDEYLQLAEVWENFNRTGLENGNLRELLRTAVAAGYQAAAIDGSGLIYAYALADGLDHEQAMAKALKQSSAFRNTADLALARKKALAAIHPDLDGQRAAAELQIGATNTSAIWENLFIELKEVRKKNAPPSRLQGRWDLDKLKAFVKDWSGTPYLYGGNSRKGIDCSAFVARAISDQFPDLHIPRSAFGISQIGTAIADTNLSAGDLIFFSYNSDQKASHVGIFLGDDLFAHASSKRGVTVSDLSQRHYKVHYIGARRLVKK